MSWDVSIKDSRALFSTHTPPLLVALSPFRVDVLPGALFSALAHMPLYRRVENNARLLEFKCVELAEELISGQYKLLPFNMAIFEPTLGDPCRVMAVFCPPELTRTYSAARLVFSFPPTPFRFSSFRRYQVLANTRNFCPFVQHSLSKVGCGYVIEDLDTVPTLPEPTDSACVLRSSQTAAGACS